MNTWSRFTLGDPAERLRADGYTIQHLQFVGFCVMLLQAWKPTAEEAIG